MEITEVRIKLMEEPGERLKAFCSITFDDCFVVRDLKIIEGTSGPFVAMPSRKLTSHCGQCGMKNHLRANHCNQCGKRLEDPPHFVDSDGRAKLYADIAHPINSDCRDMIQESVIAEFDAELERAKLPGYISRYEDYDFDDRNNNTRIDRAHNEGPTRAPHSPPNRPAIARSTPHTGQGGDSATKPTSATESQRGAGQSGGFGAGIFE